MIGVPGLFTLSVVYMTTDAMPSPPAHRSAGGPLFRCLFGRLGVSGPEFGPQDRSGVRHMHRALVGLLPGSIAGERASNDFIDCDNFLLLL